MLLCFLDANFLIPSRITARKDLSFIVFSTFPYIQTLCTIAFEYILTIQQDHHYYRQQNVTGPPMDIYRIRHLLRSLTTKSLGFCGYILSRQQSIERCRPEFTSIETGRPCPCTAARSASGPAHPPASQQRRESERARRERDRSTAPPRGLDTPTRLYAPVAPLPGRHEGTKWQNETTWLGSQLGDEQQRPEISPIDRTTRKYRLCDRALLGETGQPTYRSMATGPKGENPMLL